MLLYEYAIRDEIDRVRVIAVRVKEKFDNGTPSAELLIDAEFLNSAYERLRQMLPKEVKDNNFKRHLRFMIANLKQDRPQSCIGDIRDICAYDIPSMEKSFKDWCASKVHYDSEYASKVSSLLMSLELDSAIRKAFVILKERLVRNFSVSQEIDGRDLVNAIFGNKGLLSGRIPEAERESMRNLLDGLYGAFRNPYDHRDLDTEWFEMEAVISMINWALKKVDSYASLMIDDPS